MKELMLLVYDWLAVKLGKRPPMNVRILDIERQLSDARRRIKELDEQVKKLSYITVDHVPFKKRSHWGSLTISDGQ